MRRRRSEPSLMTLGCRFPSGAFCNVPAPAARARCASRTHSNGPPKGPCKTQSSVHHLGGPRQVFVKRIKTNWHVTSLERMRQAPGRRGGLTDDRRIAPQAFVCACVAITLSALL